MIFACSFVSPAPPQPQWCKNHVGGRWNTSKEKEDKKEEE
jgi:hypothetical protein